MVVTLVCSISVLTSCSSNDDNPVSGKIIADKIGSVTYDEFAKGHETEIRVRS